MSCISTRLFPSCLSLWITLVLSLPLPALATIVKDETIKLQKKLTTSHTLKNGIRVTYRQIENSEILELNVTFDYGLARQPHPTKMLSSVVMAAMPYGAKNWPKNKIFSTTEKYSAGIVCRAGIEISSCSLATINDYWKAVRAPFAAIITAPTFEESDIQLIVKGKIADINNRMQSPGDYVNDVVNRVFYPESHPYYEEPLTSIEALKKIKRNDLVAIHKNLLNSKSIQITVVGSLPVVELLKDLNSAFGAIKAQETKKAQIPNPPFEAKKAVAIEDRDIPTAYVHIKTNAPSRLDLELDAANLMFSILSERLADEVRTKRSLSYAVYSYLISHSVGIGVIHFSTSELAETISAITPVINQLKSKLLTVEELKEYKNQFATSYFLTLETHSSLASAISDSVFFYNSADQLYEFPNRLDVITPEQIKELANQYLVNFRVGVIYSQKKIDVKQLDEFVKMHTRKLTGK